MISYGKHSLTEDDIEAVQDVLEGDWITQGPTVDEFEDALSEYFGADYAVAVNNGTTALYLAYQALGVNEGDEVVTTPNTFVATANGIEINDGHPQFVDIDPETFNIDVSCLEQFLQDPENRENVVGIAPVHFAGLPCDMNRIHELADQYDLFVLEDACHAPGAAWKGRDGTWNQVGACSHSDAAVLSFHPVKHFTTGEGGCVLTNDRELAQSIKQLRHHGITSDSSCFESEEEGPWYYEMQDLGTNGRITDFQCALGLSQLERLDEKISKRREIADRYDHSFKEMPEINPVIVPGDRKHVYHLYVVKARARDELFDYLLDHEISPQVHYIPVPTHPYYEEEYELEELPDCANYYTQAISLPLYPTLAEREQEHVVETIKNFYN